MVASTLYGATHTSMITWNIGDIGVGAQAWLNLIAIVLLYKQGGVATLKDYEAQKKLGLDPIFDPSTVDIKGADLWHDIAQRDIRNY